MHLVGVVGVGQRLFFCVLVNGFVWVVSRWWRGGGKEGRKVCVLANGFVCVSRSRAAPLL